MLSFFALVCAVVVVVDDDDDDDDADDADDVDDRVFASAWRTTFRSWSNAGFQQ